MPIAVETKQGREMFLGGGEAKRAASCIVSSLVNSPAQILHRVDSSSDDGVWPKDLPSFGHGHVTATKMHSVGTDERAESCTVVEDESGMLMVTKAYGFPADAQHLVVSGSLHTQLYPAATTLECHPHLVKVGVAVGGMCDKLQMLHGWMISFCG